jgi:nucleoside-diphosphate-sugar epimerase
MRIIITGATGWLGREFISWYLQNVPNTEKSTLLCLASRDQRIKIGPETEIDVTAMDSNLKFGDIEGVIHLGFVIRHRVQEFGIKRYIEINRLITDRALAIIGKVQPKWVINVSSGAIFDKKSYSYEKNILDNPYGYLKREEEERLIELCNLINSNLVIGRLWGASGALMPVNPAYALSHFISSALQGKSIRIKSNHPVFRKYGDAGQFLGLLFKHAQSGATEILDSGGVLLELGELASIISSRIDNIPILRPEISNFMEDDYYPHSNRFYELSQDYDLDLLPIESQVEKTIQGHKFQLNF